MTASTNIKPVECPICGDSLKISPASSRRSKKKKVFLMLVCNTDGRHFRGFISDQTFVKEVVERSGVSPTSMGTEGTGRG